MSYLLQLVYLQAAVLFSPAVRLTASYKVLCSKM